MPVHRHPALAENILPGLSHATLAGSEHGLRELSVWSQSIAPGGATPPHRHDCEEVVVITGGAGVISIAGHDTTFRAGDTVVIPRNVAHQIFATGTEPLTLVASFSQAPVEVFFPDGTRIDLPWQKA